MFTLLLYDGVEFSLCFWLFWKIHLKRNILYIKQKSFNLGVGVHFCATVCIYIGSGRHSYIVWIIFTIFFIYVQITYKSLTAATKYTQSYVLNIHGAPNSLVYNMHLSMYIHRQAQTLLGDTWLSGMNFCWKHSYLSIRFCS